MLNKIYARRGDVYLVDEGNGIVALVNGKLYDVWSYRPIDGDGRRLREENISNIQALRENAIAECRKDDEKAAQTPVYNGISPEKVEKMVEEAASLAYNKGYAEGSEKAQKMQVTAQTGGNFAEITAFAETFANSFTNNLKEVLAPLIPQKEEPKTAKTLKNVFLHEKFDIILSNLTNNRISAESKYWYLYGPAGTGKSTIARQLAEALDVPFYSMRSVTDIYSLIGYNNAAGEYVKTDFFRAFVDGGLFFLDEIDCSDDTAVKALNDALASRIYSFPCGMFTASANFFCIAAGNTIGRGATLEYTGGRLDESTRDRFHFVKVDYDTRIEENIVKDDTELLAFCHDWRKATQKANVSALFTYRALKRVYEDVNICNIPVIDALQMGLFAGLELDDVRIIHAAAGESVNNNKYWEAIKKEYYR